MSLQEVRRAVEAVSAAKAINIFFIVVAIG